MSEKTQNIDLSSSLLDAMQQAEAVGLDAAGIEEVYYRYLSFHTHKKGVPYHGTFELTPLCNLSCKMCYVRLSPEQMGERSLLPAETWIKLIDLAAKAGMISATLTGGECLAYREFDEVYLHLQALGIRTTVLTNGVLLDEERIRFFQQYPPALIQVTLYGSSEEEYEQVCGARRFETVLANIKRANEAKLWLTIAITPNRFLPDGGETLLKLVDSLNIHYKVNSCLFAPRPGTGREKDSIDIELEDYVRIYTLRAQLSGESLTPVDPAELPVPAGSSEKQRTGLLCGGGMNVFTIQWDGTMIPCSALFQIQAFPLKSGFEAAWKTIHEAALHFPVPAECEACNYKSVCTICPALHAQEALPGHASPGQCLRTRRLVESGLVRMNLSDSNKFYQEKYGGEVI